MWSRWFSADDEDAASQERGVASLIALMPERSRDFTSVDELPGAHGAFGYTPSNPIPVNGPIGESAYIFRLRGHSDKPFCYQRLGSMNSQEFSRRLDVFEILSTDGREWRILYFSMYHLRRSRKCPDGLHLVSWKDHEVPFGIAAKLGALGSRFGPHEDFPFCLPKAIRANQDLLQMGPRIPDLCASAIEKALNGIVPVRRPYELEMLCSHLDLANGKASGLISSVLSSLELVSVPDEGASGQRKEYVPTKPTGISINPSYSPPPPF